MDTYDRIALLLEQNGERPSDLAKSTGISTGLLSQWKSRMQTPSNSKLALVAKHFDVSVDYLLTGEQKEKAAAKSDKPESKMLFLARKVEEIPPKQREELLKHFESTINIYLKANGIETEDK